MRNLLSGREFEVLELISRGYTTLEIASELYVSTETIKSHRRSLLTKMAARNVAGLIRRAFEQRLLSLEPSMAHHQRVNAIEI